MPEAAADGIQIGYTDSGARAVPVVFSHGYLLDHTMSAGRSPRSRYSTG